MADPPALIVAAAARIGVAVLLPVLPPLVAGAGDLLPFECLSVGEDAFTAAAAAVAVVEPVFESVAFGVAAAGDGVAGVFGFSVIGESCVGTASGDGSVALPLLYDALAESESDGSGLTPSVTAAPAAAEPELVAGGGVDPLCAAALFDR